jgi:hypothetical protein
MRTIKLTLYLDLVVAFIIFCIFTIKTGFGEGVLTACSLFLVSVIPILLNVLAYSFVIKFMFTQMDGRFSYLLKSLSLALLTLIEIVLWAGLAYFLAVKRGEIVQSFPETLAKEYLIYMPFFVLVAFLTPLGYRLVWRHFKEHAND